MSKSTISTFELFQMFPDQESAIAAIRKRQEGNTVPKQLLDLCSGIGGFSLAAHWVGWQTVAFCEIDKFCQKVLAKNFPGVPIYDDLFTFPSESFRGRIDVLTAGFPCQPFSAAGKRKGRDDERHIFPKIAEIVGIVQPNICVFENVRGLLSIESGSVFAEVVASLEGEGYEVITFCVPASAVEAPHRRDRLWIVAHSNGKRERAGHREVQGSNGEIPERDHDAEFGYADLCITPDAWIEAAARLCRVDDVVPNRVDRLKALGNAVVPVIPFEIFRAIEATEERRVLCQ